MKIPMNMVNGHDNTHMICGRGAMIISMNIADGLYLVGLL